MTIKRNIKREKEDIADHIMSKVRVKLGYQPASASYKTMHRDLANLSHFTLSNLWIAIKSGK